MSSIMNPPSQGLIRWEDLDLDVLKNIFNLVSLRDLFINISWVCRSWQVACWDTLLWSDPKTLDLTGFSDALGLPHLSEATEEIEKRMKMLEISLRNIIEGNYDAYGFPLERLERWRQSIRKIVIPHSLLISDKLLLFIAERTPGVETLMLFGLRNITMGGFERAICYWKNVTHFAAGTCYPREWYKYTELVTKIGRGWPQLTTLEVHAGNYQFGPGEARLIAKSLPKLTTLRFEKSRVLKEGVKYMFNFASNDCPQLKIVHFRNCRLPFGLRGLAPLSWDNYTFVYTSEGEGENWEREGEDQQRKGQDWAKDWEDNWAGYVIRGSRNT